MESRRGSQRNRLLVAEAGGRRTEPDLRVLDDYRPGDALGMVCGHGLDGVDTDPRNGGDKSRAALEADGAMPRIYGKAATPSGGTHELVATMGVRSRDNVCPGIDVKAGAPDGTGRGFLFIAPTRKRSKLDGTIGEYRWRERPDLAALAAEGPQDRSGEPLAALVDAPRKPKVPRARNTRVAPQAASDAEVAAVIAKDERAEPWNGATPDARERAYLATVLTNRAKSVANAEPGGRNRALYAAALTCGSFVAGAGLDESEVIERLAQAAEACGLTDEDGEQQVGATICSGLKNGQQNPRAVPDRAPSEVHRGQARIAYRVAERYEGALLYVTGIGWHQWDGPRWALDERGETKRAVLAELRRALAGSLEDKELRADVRKCESASGVAGVLNLAAALEPFAAAVADLDADPHLLNVANGTLDLHTLGLRPHCPADRITKVCRGAYRPGVAAPLWEGFLARVLPDVEVRRFLQRLVGLALLGAVREHVQGILTGIGANGKSVFDKTIRFVLGDYAIAAEPDLFMHREGAHPTGEMDLRGVRWVSVSESDKDRRLAEATVKRLTGGDTIRARRMRQDFVEFEPSHTPLLITNHLPKVSGDDPAIWRRLRVIPFDVVIPEAEQEKDLDARLQLEADGILAWAVAGYRDYMIRGLDEPQAVLVATDSYHRDSDAVCRFVDDECVTSRTVKATTAELFEAWVKWAVKDGAEPMSQKAFGQALDRHGYPAGDPIRGKRWRRGIAPQGSVPFAASDE